MIAKSLWTDEYPPKEPESEGNTYNSVYDISFCADEERIAVGAGSRVILYRTFTKDIIKTLKTHKDTVNSVHFSSQGNFLATGSKDKMVIVWTKYGKGILKYAHKTSVQRVRFSVANDTLISCCSEELCICYPEKKKVERLKLTSRPRSLQWSLDGSIFMIGAENGDISVYDGETGEVYRMINTPDPVWGLSFVYHSINEAINDSNISIACGYFSKCIRFYTIDGDEKRSKTNVDFEVAGLKAFFFQNLCYLVASGNNGRILFLSKDGIKISQLVLGESLLMGLDICNRRGQLVIATGSYRGHVSLSNIGFRHVYAVGTDRVAYLEGMTNVLIASIASDKRAVIQTGQAVFGIALHNEQLVTLHERQIVVYYIYDHKSSPYSLSYSLKQKITFEFGQECGDTSLQNNHFHASSGFALVVHQKKCFFINIESFSEKPDIKSITLCSDILVVQSLKSFEGQEDFAFCTVDGSIRILNVQQTSQHIVLKTKGFVNGASLALQISYDRKMLFLISKRKLEVFCIKRRECVLSRNNIKAAMFNSKIQRMIILHSYSGDVCICYFPGDDYLKAELYETGVSFQGKMALFDRSLLFSLDEENILSKHTLSYSKLILNSLSKNDLTVAVELALYGDNSYVWECILEKAMFQLDYAIAIQACCILKSYRSRWFIENLKNKRSRRSEYSKVELQYLEFVEVCLFYRRFKLATSIVGQSKLFKEGLEIFVELKLFSHARKLLTSTSIGEKESEKFKHQVFSMEAEYLISQGNYSNGVEAYYRAGLLDKAVEVAIEHSLGEELIGMARKLKSDQPEEIRLIGEGLIKIDEITLAKECFNRIGNWDALLELYLRKDEFQDAFRLSKENENKYDKRIYYHKGIYLARIGNYQEAYEAFDSCGDMDEVKNVLKALLSTSLKLENYQNASYYCFLLSTKCVNSEKLKFKIASVAYYIQEKIHAIYTTPFKTSRTYSNAFNLVCYMMEAQTYLKAVDFPFNIRLKYVLQFLIAAVGAEIPRNAAKWAMMHLKSIVINQSVMDSLELAIAKSYVREEFVSDSFVVCYRCSLLVSDLDIREFDSSKSSKTSCPVCLHPHVYSLYSFDTLPLVEFLLPTDMDNNEALALMESNSKNARYDVKEEYSFEVFLCSFDFKTASFDKYKPVTVSREVVENMLAEEVFTLGKGDKMKFFKNVLPDMDLFQCPSCECFFTAEEYDEAALYNMDCCPLCRRKSY